VDSAETDIAGQPEPDAGSDGGLRPAVWMIRWPAADQLSRSGYWVTLGLMPVPAYTSVLLRETKFMTSAVRDLLRSFQSLSDAEKHEAASLLLRQVVQGEAGDIRDDALVAIAEELFLDLDAREADDGQSSPR